MILMKTRFGELLYGSGGRDMASCGTWISTRITLGLTGQILIQQVWGEA